MFIFASSQSISVQGRRSFRGDNLVVGKCKCRHPGAYHTNQQLSEIIQILTVSTAKRNHQLNDIS